MPITATQQRPGDRSNARIWVKAAFAGGLAGLVMSVWIAPGANAQSAAVPNIGVSQASPVTGSIAPQQTASLPGDLSDGRGAPLPRARPPLAEPGLGAAAADAYGEAPLNGPAGLVTKAASYRAFQAAIDDLANRKFQAPRDVRAALDTLRTYDPESLAEGWIANSAFVAASQPAFAAAVREEVAREGQEAFLSGLRSASGVRSIDGIEQARIAVLNDTKSDYQKLTALGDRFLTTAYEFQRTRWGAYEAPAPFSVAPQFAATETVGERFASILAEVAGITPAQAYTPVMQRILSLAGYIAADAPESVSLAAMTDNRDLARCARFARLNLNQCLAAAGFPSEEAYCTGKHAVNEIASCWAQYVPSMAQ